MNPSAQRTLLQTTLCPVWLAPLRPSKSPLSLAGLQSSVLMSCIPVCRAPAASSGESWGTGGPDSECRVFLDLTQNLTERREGPGLRYHHGRGHAYPPNKIQQRSTDSVRRFQSDPRERIWSIAVGSCTSLTGTSFPTAEITTCYHPLYWLARRGCNRWKRGHSDTKWA